MRRALPRRPISRAPLITPPVLLLPIVSSVPDLSIRKPRSRGHPSLDDREVTKHFSVRVPSTLYYRTLHRALQARIYLAEQIRRDLHAADRRSRLSTRK